MLALRPMSFRNLVIGILFLAIFRMALNFSVDTDTWWQLRAGELIAQTGSIPKTDSFSSTKAGEEWRYPSNAWLTELQLYLVYAQFSFGGLNIWTALMVTLAFAFIYAAMSGAPLLRAFLLILAAAASGIYWAARPYMVSFVLAAVFLWILEDFRWGRRNRLIWLPVLMVLWANSHPGYVLGFLLLGIYLASEGASWFLACRQGAKREQKESRGRFGQLILTSLVALFGACLNPSGPAALTYSFDTVSIGVLRDYIQEWLPPNFHSWQAQPFAWLLIISIGVVGGATGLELTDFLLLAGFGYMGLVAARNVPIFALAAPIVLSRYAVVWLEKLRKLFKWKGGRQMPPPSWQGRLNAGLVLLVSLLVLLQIAATYSNDANQEIFAKREPVAAVAYINEHKPAGPIFNSYNWGGYLIWNLRDYPVYVDGRTDLYGDKILQEWLDVVQAKEGWQAVLEQGGIHLVLVEKNWPVVQLLESEHWIKLYEDQISVVYER